MCRRYSTVCDTVGVIIGVLAGIATGILFFYELLPALATVLPIVLTLGAVALGLLLVGLATTRCCTDGVFGNCLTFYGNRLLAGSLGTVVSTLVLLVFNTGTLFNLRLVLTAIVAFFFAYLLVQIVCLVTCATRRADGTGCQ